MISGMILSMKYLILQVHIVPGGLSWQKREKLSFGYHLNRYIEKSNNRPILGSGMKYASIVLLHYEK